MRRVAQMLLLLPFAACTYVDQRLTDLGDCFIWRWHQEALGANVDAKVGPLAVNVGGWYADWGIGKDTWWQRPGYTLTNHGYGIPFTTLGPIGYGQSWSRFLVTSTSGNHIKHPKAFDDATSWIFVSDVFDFDGNAPFDLTPEQKAVDLFGVEVGLTPVFVHAHVGFNIAEFFDFTLGLFGLDVFGDDRVERPPTVPFEPGQR